jgi:ankyrin repeat protein
MLPPRLPLELLLMIANHITDDHGELRCADFNAFLQINRALYSCLNPILWRSATEDSAITAWVLTHLIDGNHLARIQYFLDLGADIETGLPDFKNWDINQEEPSPLVVAAYLDNVPLACLLLEKGAILQYDEPRYYALHAARSAEMVQLLLDHHADPEKQDLFKLRPLHWYSRREGGIEAMRAVLRCGVDVNAQAHQGFTPLHYACNTDAVKLLLEFGADVKKVDWIGHTPLHRAARVRNPDVVGPLVESWPEGTRERDTDGNTPLHVAVMRGGEIAVVKLLVECWPGAVREKNQHGDTPLHKAAASWSIETVRLLLEHWPEGKLEKDNDGNTPFHVAMKSRKEWAVEGLLVECPAFREPALASEAIALLLS